MEAWAQPLAETWRLVQPGFNKVLLVMVGGGLGAVSRYGIGLLSARLWGPHFPWGTLTVNLVGCFLIGLLFAFVDRARFLTPDLRLLLVTGYLGALTTFSTFSLENVSLLQDGDYMKAGLNILLNVVLTLMATLLAIMVFKKLYS